METERTSNLLEQHYNHVRLYISSEYPKEDFGLMMLETLEDLINEVANLGIDEHLELNLYRKNLSGIEYSKGELATLDLMNRDIAYKLMRDVVDLRMVEYNENLFKV